MPGQGQIPVVKGAALELRATDSCHGRNHCGLLEARNPYPLYWDRFLMHFSRVSLNFRWQEVLSKCSTGLVPVMQTLIRKMPEVAVVCDIIL